MQERLPKWLSVSFTLIWMAAIAIVWAVAAVVVGGYLLVRRVVLPHEKWPEDEGA